MNPMSFDFGDKQLFLSGLNTPSEIFHPRMNQVMPEADNHAHCKEMIDYLKATIKELEKKSAL